jgi:hypothetical protein
MTTENQTQQPPQQPQPQQPQMTVETAFGHVQQAARAFKGDADQHDVLKTSLQVIAQNLNALGAIRKEQADTATAAAEKSAADVAAKKAAATAEQDAAKANGSGEPTADEATEADATEAEGQDESPALDS